MDWRREPLVCLFQVEHLFVYKLEIFFQRTFVAIFVAYQNTLGKVIGCKGPILHSVDQ